MPGPMEVAQGPRNTVGGQGHNGPHHNGDSDYSHHKAPQEDGLRGNTVAVSTQCGGDSQLSWDSGVLNTSPASPPFPLWTRKYLKTLSFRVPSSSHIKKQ